MMCMFTGYQYLFGGEGGIGVLFKERFDLAVADVEREVAGRECGQNVVAEVGRGAAAHVRHVRRVVPLHLISGKVVLNHVTCAANATSDPDHKSHEWQGSCPPSQESSMSGDSCAEACTCIGFIDRGALQLIQPQHAGMNVVVHLHQDLQTLPLLVIRSSEARELKDCMISLFLWQCMVG